MTFLRNNLLNVAQIFSDLRAIWKIILIRILPWAASQSRSTPLRPSSWLSSPSSSSSSPSSAAAALSRRTNACSAHTSQSFWWVSDVEWATYLQYRVKQCDQMSILVIIQSLAIYNNENLPSCIKCQSRHTKVFQIKKITTQKFAQRLLNFAKSGQTGGKYPHTAGLQISWFGFKQTRNILLFGCSKAIESTLIKVETTCMYSGYFNLQEYSPTYLWGKWPITATDLLL